jgi:thiol:disulfide interchange protein DsbA
MKRRQFALATAALPGLLALSARAQPAKGYTELTQRAPTESPAGKIEALEFFSYGCPHCMHFEPAFSNWKKNAPDDVAVLRVHVAFQRNFEPLQRIYYALEALGKADDPVHAKVFEALQVQRKRLDRPEVLFPWMAEQGVDRARFEEIYKSFGVTTKVNRAIQLQDAYGVEGTPALGIAGRFYTDSTLAGSFERMLQIANTLIAQVRKDG